MSQSSVILPGSPLTGSTMVSDINASFASVISKFSGATAPTLGPGVSNALVVGQWWLDTSTTPNVLKSWDGAVWCPLASLDPTGHTFSPPSTWRNILSDNGGFEVWQRGAGSSASIAVGASSTAYTADRWYLTTGANQASVVAAVAAITPIGILSGKVQRNNAQTGTGTMTFGFPLDSDELDRVHGQKVTLGFLAKAGTNWSPASGALTAAFYVGTGAVGKRGGGFVGETNVASVVTNLVAGVLTAQSVTSSAVVPANASQGEVQFTWAPTGTAGADDSVSLDNVQLEIGVFPSLFETIPFEKALLGCKRHFWKTFLYGTAPAQNAGSNTGELQETVGKAGATALASLLFARHPVSMRATPAVTTFNPRAGNAQVARETGTSSPADQTATATQNVTTESATITATGDANGATGDIIGVHLTVDSGI